MIYKAPDWLYCPASIDLSLLPQLKKEISKFSIAVKEIPTNDRRGLAFHTDDLDLIKNMCPCLIKEFIRLGIDQLLDHVSIITIDPAKPPVPIHRDCDDISVPTFGLNIPVINCEDTYTVWYDTELDKNSPVPAHFAGSPIIYTTVPAANQHATEIDRCSAATPHWVNNWVPHAARSDHNKIRVNSSWRFKKEIYNLLENGYFDKHLVQHSLTSC
jgi:hypothetical protein